MKNKEFYKNEIMDIVILGYSFGVMDNKPITCSSEYCKNCIFSNFNKQCSILRMDWLEEEHEESLFEFNEGDTIYFINSIGEVTRGNYLGDKFNEEFIKYGNACKNKAFMEKKAKEIKLYNLLRNFSFEVNDDWEPNWGNIEEYKYTIAKENGLTWVPTRSTAFKIVNGIYFKSKELAQRAIDEIAIPFEEGRL